jgi:hypothetical protein
MDVHPSDGPPPALESPGRAGSAGGQPIPAKGRSEGTGDAGQLLIGDGVPPRPMSVSGYAAQPRTQPLAGRWIRQSPRRCRPGGRRHRRRRARTGAGRRASARRGRRRVEGAGDVDAGHGQGKASGQLLGDVGPATDHVDERGRTGAWRLVRLPHEQVDQHGEYDRGDYREHDHEQASWPAAQWPYLHPSRSHLLTPARGTRDRLPRLAVMELRRYAIRDQAGKAWSRRGAQVGPLPGGTASRVYILVVVWVAWSRTSWAFCLALWARSWPCSRPCRLAVSAALLAASWATCLPRFRASWPVSLTLSLT